MSFTSGSEVEERLKRLWLDAMDGCDDSYRQFLLGLTPLLRRFFARRLSQHWEDAEDLTQEVLMAVHRQRHRIDLAYPVTAWVYAVARYKLIDHYRRLSRQPEVIELDDSTLSLDDDSLFSAQDDTDLTVLLDELPNGQRDAIRLVKLEGWSVRDASQMTGQSESLVKVNIHRGVQRLINGYKRVTE
ncbi:MAG: sigma-70 family RNA polymerase sigma factor [Alphaproteobacteria bacterium]|nr:sigma-70 family RNA polymerase sigma factor [Alphaproteobacteria bacterium]